MCDRFRKHEIQKDSCRAWNLIAKHAAFHKFRKDFDEEDISQ